MVKVLSSLLPFEQGMPQAEADPFCQCGDPLSQHQDRGCRPCKAPGCKGRWQDMGIAAFATG